MNLSGGTILDLIVIGIILFSAISGYSRGFALTLSSFAQWFVCLIAGFILCSHVKDYLVYYTTIDDSLRNYILKGMNDSIQGSSSYEAVPDLFSPWIKDASEAFATGTASSITDMLLTIISFLIVVFGIKIVCFLIARVFSSKYHPGVIGCFDRLIGLLFGFVRGFVYVFVLFAVMIPVLSLIWPDIATFILGNMDKSNIAEYMYDNNFLLLIIRDLFS